VSSLVPSGQSDRHDLNDLRTRVAEIETKLGERATEIARVTRELTAFKIDYRQRVGRLHEELDELEAAIAAAELGHISKRLEEESSGGGESAARAAGAEPTPRYSSDAVRKLFRDVAKIIHPDLAEDDDARNRRHALMIEANRAYASGDEERLRWILQSWELRPEAIEGTDDDAARARIARRLAQLQEQLALVDGDLDALKDSPMWKLKVMVDQSAANGKDLVRDMVARLKVDIMIARNRLHAIEFDDRAGRAASSSE